MIFDFCRLNCAIHSDNLYGSDFNSIKTKAVYTRQPSQLIHFVAQFITSFKRWHSSSKRDEIIHLSFRSLCSVCKMLCIRLTWFTWTFVVYNYWCCQCNRVFQCIRIYSSLLHTFNSVPPSSSSFPNPLSSFSQPLTNWEEQKTCQIFYLNFYELINRWIYEFLNLSYTLRHSICAQGRKEILFTASNVTQNWYKLQYSYKAISLEVSQAINSTEVRLFHGNWSSSQLKGIKYSISEWKSKENWIHTWISSE